VKRVMRDHQTFSSEAMAALVTRPISYNEQAIDEGYEQAMSIIGTDGATHERLRVIVNRGFTPRRMGQMEAEIRAIARDFVEPLVAGGTGDLQAGLAVPFPISVIAALLGVDPDRRDDFRRWSEQMVIAVFEPSSAHEQGEIASSNEQMGEWIEAVIAERTGQLGDDLVSVLLRAELEGGALSAEELRVFVITLLVAGSITTAYLIGSADRRRIASV
jgi:cytochrome P450